MPRAISTSGQASASSPRSRITPSATTSSARPGSAISPNPAEDPHEKAQACRAALTKPRSLCRHGLPGLDPGRRPTIHEFLVRYCRASVLRVVQQIVVSGQLWPVEPRLALHYTVTEDRL